MLTALQRHLSEHCLEKYFHSDKGQKLSRSHQKASLHAKRQRKAFIRLGCLAHQLLRDWGSDLQSKRSKWLLTCQTASTRKQGTSQEHIFSLLLKNMLSPHLIFQLCSNQHHLHTLWQTSPLCRWHCLETSWLIDWTAISAFSASTKRGSQPQLVSHPCLN